MHSLCLRWLGCPPGMRACAMQQFGRPPPPPPLLAGLA